MSTYISEPSEMPVMEYDPLSLSEEDTKAVQALVEKADMVAVRAAHLYTRKGFHDTDNFAGNPNRGYRGSQDDIVVQVTFLVPGHDRNHQDAYDTMTGIYTRAQEAKHAAEVEAREAEVARAQAAAEAAQAALVAARGRRDAALMR